MGKNKSKHKMVTEYARWESVMKKLDNEIKKQDVEQKKNAEKKPKEKKDDVDAE